MGMGLTSMNLEFEKVESDGNFLKLDYSDDLIAQYIYWK